MRMPVILLAVGGLIAGCARSAPPLPADTGSVDGVRLKLEDFALADQKLSCPGIDQHLLAKTREAKANNAVIKSERVRNQVVGFFAMYAIVPAFATENNDAQKAALEKIQRRWDELIALRRLKNCGELAVQLK